MPSISVLFMGPLALVDKPVDERCRANRPQRPMFDKQELPADRVGASERQPPVAPRYRRDRDQDGRTERQP